MAEKRQREESPEMEGEISKRCKPYDDILSILEDEEEEEEEEEEPNTAQEIQAEVSSSFSDFGPVICGTAHEVEAQTTQEDDGLDVIRHLLEASDDELGIPTRGMDGADNTDGNGIDGQDFPFSLCDGWWEFEDLSANYYSLLQSELFM